MTFSGRGKLLLMTKDGETQCQDMLPGVVNYIPGGWVHRIVNVGKETFDFIWFYSCLVVYDYESILETGYASVAKTAVGEHVFFSS